jgi:para-aminobenzoate synthetase component 1
LRGWFAHAGSAALVSGGARYSYFLAEPIAATELAHDDPADAGDALHEALAFVRADQAQAGLPPFTGGALGVAAFELGLRLESLKRRPFRIEGRRAWPELMVWLYPAVLAFDHEQQRLLAIGRGATDAEAQARCDALAALYAATPVLLAPEGPLSRGALQLETPDEVHEDKVAALIRQIQAGDLFQANLARGWTGVLREGVTPGEVMAALNAAGAAPFGGFVRWNDRAVVSNSPERFIRLGADGMLETRPIKGTRPRGRTPAEDAALAAELMASAKDRAENLMIVDLMRHDLSRVAEIGSVTVPELHALESFASVHHLVSTVRGRLQAGLTAADVLAATLPPGSVSGAPKVQAMKVIGEMEAARGPYCGSLFYVDAGGAMESSVLIRTLACERDDAGAWHFRAAAGGGIVADSDPVAERIETETKMALIRRVVEQGLG